MLKQILLTFVPHLVWPLKHYSMNGRYVKHVDCHEDHVAYDVDDLLRQLFVSDVLNCDYGNVYKNLSCGKLILQDGQHPKRPLYIETKRKFYIFFVSSKSYTYFLTHKAIKYLLKDNLF